MILKVGAAAAAMVMTVGGLTFNAAAVAPACAADISYTGTEVPYVVPAGADTLHVVATGAGGGARGRAFGGAGAVVTADIPVTSGETLTVAVGQGGSIEGGGGASTTLRRGSTALVIAGGGGAGGDRSNGGDAGALSSGAGSDGAGICNGLGGHDGTGGGGSDANGGSGAGGAGGANFNGTRAFGGTGTGTGADASSDAAGGGGGGYGGGGSGTGGGGGGGSFGPGNSTIANTGLRVQCKDGDNGSMSIEASGTPDPEPAPTPVMQDQSPVPALPMPAKLKSPGTTLILPRHSVTNAAQPVKAAVKVTPIFASRGDVTYYRVIRKANGSVRLALAGNQKLRVHVTYSAAATEGFTSYTSSQRYVVKKNGSSRQVPVATRGVQILC